MDALSLIEAGGPVMYLLAGLSVVSLTVILFKLLQFAMSRVWNRRSIEAALASWHAGRDDETLAMLEPARSPVAQVLLVAVRSRLGTNFDPAAVREEVERVATRHLGQMQNGLRLLSTIANLAPLLGLLGTVIGMIDAFQALEAAGNKVDPAILSGGIWVALLTTAAGLVVAIPAAAAHQWLEAIVDRTGRTMEDAVTQIFTHQPAQPLRRSTPIATSAAL